MCQSLSMFNQTIEEDKGESDQESGGRQRKKQYRYKTQNKNGPEIVNNIHEEGPQDGSGDDMNYEEYEHDESGDQMRKFINNRHFQSELYLNIINRISKYD